ncbi:hypothetical protein [Streptosporangium sp. NPDC087985]|uniref:hypothetical protein n=1 Tax=Streptosporangium sp. NPDC087985 TaxID=3366196 RepID=UPI00380FE64F
MAGPGREVIPQAVLSPLTRAALFLVVTVYRAVATPSDLLFHIRARGGRVDGVVFHMGDRFLALEKGQP